jgi:protein Tex
VHPETYPVVNAILDNTGKAIRDLIGQSQFLRSLNPANYTNADFGLPTVTDIFQELEKPGRDPRPEFKSVQFMEGVEKITDLQPGMTLEGVVTNVAAFGAFVDIGVHQDGLVHISHLADDFVKDPRDVVKAGDMVKVRVLEVDVSRQRISLSMKKNIDTNEIVSNEKPQKITHKPKPQPALQNSMSNAFAKALKK